MKKLLFLSIILISIFIISFSAYNKFSNRSDSKNHYVSIDNLVSEAITTRSGYTDELSKHMSKNVYLKLNVYALYDKDSDNSDSIKVSLTLNEVNQHKKNDEIFVYMICDRHVTDQNGNTLLSGKIPIIFTVIYKEDQIYIKDAQEFLSYDDVPNEFK